MGRWVNDAANWNQKWQLNGAGAVCLTNTPPQEEADGVDDMPWLSLGQNKQKQEKQPGDVKARLWSPPIPSAVGMRCLTMTFLIDAPTESGLSLLQRQEG